MYGWRGRIGLLIPSSNTTMEEEFRRVLPEGVSLHVARMRLKNVTVKELMEMEKYALNAVEELVDADVDLIVYGCTTGSLIGGINYDTHLSRMLSERAGIPVITTATAVCKALKTLNISKVSVATPYIEDVNLKEKEFLEAHGFKVVKIKGLGITSNIEIGKQPPHIVYKLAREVDNSEADGIFISCTNLRTLEIIDVLERDLDKPIVSSNQATLWATLKTLRVKERYDKLGVLIRNHL